MIALTATATGAVRSDVIGKLEMSGCKLVCLSPNRPNIYFEVKRRVDIDNDMAPLVRDLLANKNKAERILIYCRSLNVCSDLFAHFCYALGEANSYYPESAEHISDNRLYGMFHAKTPAHNKEVILKSMQDEYGIVRVVFCTVALGMGANFAGLNCIIHYGAPRSIEDYFQECGRAGRSGDPARSVIYWAPIEAPIRKKFVHPCDAEIAAVRHYLENVSECCRRQLLNYFDPTFSGDILVQDPLLCCDVCANTTLQTIE